MLTANRVRFPQTMDDDREPDRGGRKAGGGEGERGSRLVGNEVDQPVIWRPIFI